MFFYYGFIHRQLSSLTHCFNAAVSIAKLTLLSTYERIYIYIYILKYSIFWNV
jgi:hypothetical protein